MSNKIVGLYFMQGQSMNKFISWQTCIQWGTTEKRDIICN